MELKVVILLQDMLIKEYVRLTNLINNAIDKGDDFESYKWLDKKEELIYIINEFIEIIEKCNKVKEF